MNAQSYVPDLLGHSLQRLITVGHIGLQALHLVRDSYIGTNLKTFQNPNLNGARAGKDAATWHQVISAKDANGLD